VKVPGTATYKKAWNICPKDIDFVSIPTIFYGILELFRQSVIFRCLFYGILKNKMQYCGQKKFSI
jgi:bacteriorhodopsin